MTHSDEERLISCFERIAAAVEEIAARDRWVPVGGGLHRASSITRIETGAGGVGFYTPTHDHPPSHSGMSFDELREALVFSSKEN